MSPWIEATRPVEASRWLDDLDVALYAYARAAALVFADLHKDQGPSLEAITGRSSVSAALSVRHVMAGSSAGSSSASGLIGSVYEQAGLSVGSSQVSGDLLHGQVEIIAGSSTGRPQLVTGWLTVRQYNKLVGSQANDDWGSFPGQQPPTGGSRDDGHTRSRFTPISTGLANELESTP